NRRAALGRLATSLGDHRRREIDAGDAMTARGELEREEPRAAADIERVELGAGGNHEIEDAIPGDALAWCADAVAEVCVEPGRPPVPVRRDLLLDVVGLTGPAGTHGLYLLDHFDLHSVGRLEEGDAPAVVGRKLFEDADALGPELRQRARIVVGIH